MNKISIDQLENLYKINVAAYKGKPFQGDQYRFVSSKDKNGYYGSAHDNQVSKELIFTHRGTDEINLWGYDKQNYDFITDGFKKQDFEGYGKCTECNEAIAFIDDVLKDDKYKDFSVIITGHSLGALLSDVTLYHLKTKNPTLNYMSIVFANPGSKPFLEKVATQQGERLDTNLYKSLSLAINLKGDKLVNHENQLGSEWFIDSGKDWPCPSWSDQVICTYAGNNHMLKNIRNAIDALEVEQMNKNLPTGWQFLISTKTIIEEVKELTIGDEAEIARVNVDGSDYDIKFQLDNSESENIISNMIHIVRTSLPDSEEKLADIVNSLYIKKDGSGGLIIGTDSSDAVQLNCNSSVFSVKEVTKCDDLVTPALTKTIIEEVKGLSSGDEVEIAKVTIDGSMISSFN